jgi:hypothetical protein
MYVVVGRARKGAKAKSKQVASKKNKAQAKMQREEK